jgi:hypothetical protein
MLNKRSLIVTAALLVLAARPGLVGAHTSEPAAKAERPSMDEAWRIDSDGDGVADLVEAFYRTSAYDRAERPAIDLRDTDGDGVPDLTERAHGKNPADARQYPVPELPDTDGDGAPDIHEILAGKDPFSADGPAPVAKERGSEATAAPAQPNDPGFVTNFCRPGFQRSDPAGRLCIQIAANNARAYDVASAICRDRESRVCTYEDLFYRFLFSDGDAAYNPLGAWLGTMTGDGEVLCGNKSIIVDGDGDEDDFEGTCSKHDLRIFWCCHDLDV